MDKLNPAVSRRELCGRLLLLLSFGAVIMMFWVPSFTHSFIAAGIFAAAAAVVFAGLVPLRPVPGRFVKAVSAIISATVIWLGTKKLSVVWQGKRLAGFVERYGASESTVITIASLILGTAGVYSVFVLCCWCIDRIAAQLTGGEDRDAAAGLRSNWFFPLSALAFAMISTDSESPLFYDMADIRCLAGVIIAVAASLVIAAYAPPLTKMIRGSRPAVNIISALTAVGIIWCFLDMYAIILPLPSVPAKAVTIGYPVCAILSLPFIFVCLVRFWNCLLRIFSEHGTFSVITRGEAVFYAALIITALSVMAVLFCRSDAYYGTEYLNDIIFTGDSPSIARDNAYMLLIHRENDVRQPLFALFSAPFVGIFWLIGRLTGASAPVCAILMNSVQLVLLFVSGFLLARAMKLGALKRACFMLIFSTSFSFILFSLMMEQYIFSCFWLILCIYLICEDGRPAPAAVWGAGGTLLTSFILFPFLSDKPPLKKLRGWLSDMADNAVGLLCLMLVFCRFDIISSFSSRLILLRGFSGEALTLTDKLRQYTTFISSIFTAPQGAAAEASAAIEHISWQMLPVQRVCLTGVIIMIVAAVGIILSRGRKITLLSAGWIAFSAAVLVILGWGAPENGMILYSLYFGWAFIVPIFTLADIIEEKLGVRFIVPVFSVCLSAIMLWVNIPATAQIIRFVEEYFPI